MKFRYTFSKGDKTITFQLTLESMFIYKNKYIGNGYAVDLREVRIDGEWIDLEIFNNLI